MDKIRVTYIVVKLQEVNKGNLLRIFKDKLRPGGETKLFANIGQLIELVLKNSGKQKKCLFKLNTSNN